MTLLLEALQATDGDCLLLHHGSKATPHLILVDGGRSKSVDTTLMPRLEELRRAAAGGAGEPELAIELTVLSHIDADHVAGLVKLTQEMIDRQDAREPTGWWLGEIWMNGFDQVLGNQETQRLLLPDAGPAPGGVAASVKQTCELRNNLDRLGVAVNHSMGGELVGRPDDHVVPVPWEDLELSVLAPTRAELQALETVWDKELQALRAGKPAGGDSEIINAASIVLLVEQDGRSLLLTGDARTEDIVRGLTAAGRLRDGGPPCTVDVLKLPHHGADGNCTEELFERVHARHYVICAGPDDKNQNPDPRTLERLWAARGGDSKQWTLHVTFADGQVKHFDDWRRSHPAAQVVYRDAKAPGTMIELA
jgi:beta-lactamase superfamily II metal-dependent hydrolase